LFSFLRLRTIGEQWI